MHQSSMEAMQGFVDQYLAERRGQRLRVLDVGSMNVNGSYRTLSEQPGWTYTGIHVAALDANLCRCGAHTPSATAAPLSNRDRPPRNRAGCPGPPCPN